MSLDSIDKASNACEDSTAIHPPLVEDIFAVALNLSTQQGNHEKQYDHWFLPCAVTR